MPQALIGFNGVPVTGGRMTLSRGIRPSVCTLSVFPQTTWDRQVGTLELGQGATLIQFPDSACPAPVFYHRKFRDKHAWSIHVLDRRWKWRYPTIDGEYNKRRVDGKIPADSRNLRQLVELCLDAMGETNRDTSQVPDTVYPPVQWNRSKAAVELEWLLDLVAMTIVLKLDNTVCCVPQHDPTITALPNFPILTTNQHSWKSALIPSEVCVQGDPTIYQSNLDLESVAQDNDGTIRTLATVSYAPTGWPEYMNLVPEADRHLAFKTAYRWFRPSGGWNTQDTAVADYRQLELIDRLSEVGIDPVDTKEIPLQAVINGQYWPGSEHPVNAVDGRWAGRHRVPEDMCLIETEEPVFQISQTSEVAEPALKAYISYRLKDQQGVPVTYSRSEVVPQSNCTTRPLVLHHPELTKVRIDDPFIGTLGDNCTEIDAEMQVYINAYKQMYSYTTSTENTYGGLQAINLDGGVSQVEWRAGDGSVGSTRVGLHTEFDLKNIQERQARAMHKLAQVATRMAL